MADTKGRKNTAVTAGIGVALATLAFGFTYNFSWAMTTRFLQGCFMGM